MATSITPLASQLEIDFSGNEKRPPFAEIDRLCELFPVGSYIREKNELIEELQFIFEKITLGDIKATPDTICLMWYFLDVLRTKIFCIFKCIEVIQSPEMIKYTVSLFFHGRWHYAFKLLKGVKTVHLYTIGDIKKSLDAWHPHHKDSK